MIVQAPQSKVRMPTFHEGSGLRSPRDADATARQWLKAKTTTHNENGNNNQLFYMMQKLSRQRRRIPGGSGSTASTGMKWSGEYNGGSYKPQNVVTFTPDGQSAGNYVALRNVPAGVSPDVGFPYWQAFSVPAPGIWG